MYCYTTDDLRKHGLWRASVDTLPRKGCLYIIMCMMTLYFCCTGYTSLNLQHFPFQVKVLVPNSTAGMVIGKAGVYIRQIKEDSGAYVQISQKSKDLNLPERCVTIAGMHIQNSRSHPN